MEEKLKEISLHLLDLGKRNRLINFKSAGYRNVLVHNNDFEEVFTKITNGAELHVFDLDPVLQKYHKTIDATGEEVAEYSLAKVKDIVTPLLKTNDLFCYKKGIPLNKLLRVIYREYKNTLLEKGINTLYITFGMVEYEEKKEKYQAPLLLIPLSVTYDARGFRIKESDDEIVLNPTLAYLLETEMGVHLDEYIETETSIQEYMSKMSSLLVEHKMSLSFTVTIGIFSFLKMNMFNDLREHSNIVLQNQNILRLLGNGEEETNFQENKIYPVVDADESQLAAISYAANGGSFVLQGPPGTGKSQTITNIIASLIGSGKKVLFVSEKQAALNVVYENLKRAGLDSFAIELHSHKANKKEFIDELYNTAILPRYDIKNDVFQLEDKYASLSETLEEYRTKLHQPIHHLNLSMYEVYSASLKVEKTDFLYPITDFDLLNIQELDQVKECFEQYSTLSASLGYDYHQGPFYGFISTDLSYIRYQAQEDIEKLYHFYTDLIEIQKMITEALPFSIHSYKNIIDAMPYLDSIIQINYFLPDYFIVEKRKLLCTRIEKYQEVSERIKKSTLKQFLDLKILQLDGLEEFTTEFARQSQRRLKWLTPGYYKIKKEVSAFLKLKMKDQDVLLKLNEAIAYKKDLLLLTKVKKQLPEGYRPVEYDVLLSDARQLNDLPFSLNLTEDSYSVLKRKLMDILIKIKNCCTISFSNYIDKFDQNILPFIEGNMQDLVLRLKDMASSIDLLNLHAERLEVLHHLEEHHMMDFLDQMILHEINLKKFGVCYEQSFWQANILYMLEHVSIFKAFSNLGIEKIVSEFKQLDHMHLETNKAYIVSKLSNMRPDESIMVGSRFSVLVREHNKSRKHKPIRMLLEEIFDLILDIKPVFLMSPLSVSTYLNSQLNMFDAVIFDEASQVYAWDALGAIYRAKQCIIIGDSKQMPPSNFFMSMSEDETDYENDMESILDKGSSVFPTKRLNWHYRSRSEELIAFSNQNFYDGRLITIPQAKQHTKGFGVDFHYVIGTYEVKARTNVKEAEYIVDLVFTHIQTRPELSLGVVAFSTAQAELIYDLIEERLEATPDSKFFFQEDRREPFFVKNLESVQGDERDVIIFSICYGYTIENKFYQRFGPLNVLGGERRLNVAITRAKENVCIVSSIHASDIHLDQTDSLGVAMLKKYLAYAESISTPKLMSMDTEDGVILSIQKFLQKSGYKCQTKIGYSDFKIDLAVWDKTTESYRIAIMLDGPSYQIGNCSDANALQEHLLTRLGWKFLRVFSSQWVCQQKMEQERILKFIQESLSTTKHDSLEQPKEESFLIEKEDTFDDSFDPYPYVTEEQILKLYHTKKPTEVIRYIISKEEPIHIDYLLKRICFMYGRTKVTGLVREYFNKDIESLNLFRDHDFLSLHPIVPLGLRIPSDRSIEYIHMEELKDAIYKVVKTSNGITKEGCFKKVIGLLGYNRMTENSIQILDQALVYLKLDGKLIEKEDCLYS